MIELNKEEERVFTNFTMIRNGIRDHIEVGQFSDKELGVYLFLNLYSAFDFKINFTNAQAVATTFAHPSVSHRSVQNCFQNLRAKGYIDYPVGGAGKGQLFPVLILKAEPTCGVLKGARLIGFGDKDLQTVLYEFQNASRAHAVLKMWEGEYVTSAHHVGCVCASCARPVLVRVPLQEVKLKRTPKYEKVEKGEEGEEGHARPFGAGAGK